MHRQNARNVATATGANTETDQDMARRAAEEASALVVRAALALRQGDGEGMDDGIWMAE